MADTENLTEENSVPFYPDHVSNEAKVVLGIAVVAILIGLIGLFAPVGLGDPADPMNTPAHVKP
jgi:quinol-cytochrome oxidoreductase complex cytochrome b subunit